MKKSKKTTLLTDFSGKTTSICRKSMITTLLTDFSGKKTTIRPVKKLAMVTPLKRSTNTMLLADSNRKTAANHLVPIWLY